MAFITDESMRLLEAIDAFRENRIIEVLTVKIGPKASII